MYRTYNRPVLRNPKTISLNSEVHFVPLSNAVNLNCKANAIENVVCEALFDLPTFRSLQKNDLSSPNAWINKKVNV